MILLIASPSNAMWNGIAENSGAIEAIAAVLNLALVIVFFFRDKWGFIKEKTEEYERKYIAIGIIYW